ncbi:MAG: GTP cyclohydrolase I FolE [Candidatus Dadabacteria bacterium]|nr:MAG: GTP cyclohydrolase I FolE [Candidatus Dadabacteria bacterium]
MTEKNDPVEPLIRDLLKSLGEDPDREGLQRTPERVARMYRQILSGYDADPIEILNDAVFSIEYDEMVIVKDIEFYSLCEHHMLPFFGKAFVAYVPDKKVVGLSKIPRLVDMFARRLQVQERMTQQIADILEEILQPKGVAVAINARHMCMSMRGVQKRQASMITSAMRGAFRDDARTRGEFLALVTSTTHD